MNRDVSDNENNFCFAISSRILIATSYNGTWLLFSGLVACSLLRKSNPASTLHF